MLIRKINAAIVCFLFVIYAPPMFAQDADVPPDLTKTVLKVGSEIGYPPYADVDKDGKATGFSVELIKAVAKSVNLQIEFVVGPWNEVRRKLETGEVDMLPLVGYSKERDEVFDFSIQHTSNMSIFLTKSGKVSLSELSDIGDYTVLVMDSDSTHDYLVKQGFAGNLILKKTVKEVLTSLDGGEANLAFAPEIPSYLTLQSLNITNIKKTGKPVDVFFGKGFSFAVQEGNTELLHLLNAGLKIAKLDGSYDRLYKQWFGNIIPEPAIPSYLIRYAIIAAVVIAMLGLILIIGIVILRRKVAVQTQELETRANTLKQNNENLLRLNQELEEFAHAASHDLKAPLKSVSGQITLLQDLFLQDVPDQGKKLFTNINTGISRMTAMIDGLLKYAEITNTDAETEMVDINKLLDMLLDDLHADIVSAQAEVDISQCGTVLGNPVSIQQVFQNLITNALKYRRAEAKLYIKIEAEELDQFWQFSVSDNGQGIDAQHHQRIFRLFSRLHTQSDIEGVGLGLNLCQKAVNAHGGKLWLTSEVGQGSTFFFTLPKRL